MAAIAQLGERQTEDLKVPGSIPGLGISNTSQPPLCVSPNCFGNELEHNTFAKLAWHPHTGSVWAPFTE